MYFFKLMTMRWPKGCTYFQTLYLNCDFRNDLKCDVQQHHTLLSSPCSGSEGEGLRKGKPRQADGTELLHPCSEKLGSRTPEHTVWYTRPMLKHSWALQISTKKYNDRKEKSSWIHPSPQEITALASDCMASRLGPQIVNICYEQNPKYACSSQRLFSMAKELRQLASPTTWLCILLMALQFLPLTGHLWVPDAFAVL